MKPAKTKLPPNGPQTAPKRGHKAKKRKKAKKPAAKKAYKHLGNPDEVRISVAKNNQMRLSSCNPFFENEILAEWQGNNEHRSLVLHIASMNAAKAIKPVKTMYTYVFYIQGTCDPGKYIIDKEESNEDQLIIYLFE